MNWIKFIRIFLLVLIIIGLGLLATQKIWVPKLVDAILSSETTSSVLETGTENNTNNQSKDTCVSNDKYFVIEQSVTDGVGSNHLVKYKTIGSQNVACQYVVGKGDFEIKNQSAEYTLALENNYLILDSGTGPGPRGLIVYDLNLRKKVYEDSYSQPIVIQNNTIEYWTATSTKATEENCPDFKQWNENGLGAAIDAHVSLNLSTLAKTQLGEYRCSVRQ